MSNLMNIVKKTIVDNSDTVSSITSIKHDAAIIRKTVINETQNVKSYVTELKRRNVGIRSIGEWLKSNGGFDTESTYDVDDDTDYGFSTEEFDIQNESSEKASLDKDHMRDLVDGVQKQQFAIARQTIESQLHATSEIIISTNARSSELLASIKSITSNALTVSKKLEFLTEKYNETSRRVLSERRYLDRDGLLTLGNVLSFMRNSFGKSSFNLVEFLREKTIIGLVDQQISDTILNFQTSMMRRILSFGIMQKIFGNPLRLNGNTDYSVANINKYTKDPAPFDGITRKTIVDIIPGYLQKLSAGITSQTYHISRYGTLTTEKTENLFQKQIDSTFDISHVGERFFKALEESNPTVNKSDMRKLIQILMSQYIFLSYAKGTAMVSREDLMYGGFTDVNGHVVKLCAKNSTGKDEKYWRSIMIIIETEFRNNKRFCQKFANAINSGFMNLDDAAKRIASNMSDPSVNMKYSQDMFDEYAAERISSHNELALYEGYTPNELIRRHIFTKDQIPKVFMRSPDQPIILNEYIADSADDMYLSKITDNAFTRLTYVQGIFDILNRGINVSMRFRPDPNANIDIRTWTADTMNQGPSSTKTQGLPKTAGEIVNSIQQHGGFIGAASYLVKEEFSKMHSDFSMFADIGKNKTASLFDKAMLSYDAKHALKSDNSSDAEKNDAETITMVLGGMKTLSTDGEIDPNDLSMLNAQIQTISDPKKRDQLASLVKNVADNSKSKPKAKSLLGRALLFVLGLAKTSVTKVVNVFKPFLLKAGSFYKKIFTSAFRDITGGTRAIKESLVGTKGNRNGLLIQGGRLIKDTYGTIGTIYLSVKNAAKSTAFNLASAARSKIYEKRYQRGETRSIGTQIGDMTEAAVTKIGQQITKPVGRITSAFTQTKFGQGFAAAFSKSPEEEIAKEKAKRTIITPLDKYTSDISDAIKDIASSSTTLSYLLIAFNQFGEFILDMTEWVRDRKSAKAKHEERKRLAAEKKKQQEAEKQQEEPMSFMGNIGKMVGGFTQILGGIFRSVLAIIKTMSGLTAIMNIGEEILKRSLKPINKIFTRIYRMLKPVVRTITKTLKQIVELMTTVVTSIIEIIQPIFQALVPIIEALLDALTPILKLVTDLVNVILIPITATINSVLVPMLQSISNTIQFISGLFEMGFGAVMWGVGGVITLMGGLVKWLAGDKVKDVGKNLTAQGESFMKLGANDMETAIHSSVDLFKSQLDKLIPGEKKEPTKTTTNRQIDTRLRGSAFDTTYGSGDDDDALYTLGDDIKDAFAEIRAGAERLTKIFSDDEDYDLSEGKFSDLSKIARQIIGIFTGEENETVEERLDRETRKQRESQTTIDRDSLTDDEKQQIEDMAYQEFLKNTNTTGMSEDKIQKKYKREKSKYLDYATRLFIKDKKESDHQSGMGKWFDEAFGENGKLTAASSELSSQFDNIEQGGFQRLVQEYQASRPSNGSSYQSGLMGQSRIAYEGDLQAGDIWNAHKNKSGVANFMRAAFSAGLTGAQVATIASTGIWEDGGDKIFGTKSLTNTTYDVNGQQAVGIMNWMDKSVNYGSTVAEQLQYIKRTYFDASSSDSRARASDNGYWSQDESAYRKATGRSGFRIGKGERYGPVMEQDLIEGSEQFFRTALVPACIHVPEGPRKYIGTAIGVYNWLIDNGYINNASQNGTYTGVLTGNSEAERIYNYLVSMGMSKAAAAGILGCFHYESGMKSNNLEDAYNSQFGMSDEQYTAAVDAKRESKQSFITGRNATYISGQTPGEAVGYGLAQFTSSDLKREIYENSVEKGKSISDPAAQLETLVTQLKKRGLYNALNAAGSPTEANKLFLWKYEAGTGYTSDAAVLSSYPWMQRSTDGYPNAVAARHGMAEKYYKQFGNNPTYSITPTNAGALYGGRSAQQRGSKADWIRTVAMMFEGYYNNGDRTYDAKNLHKFKIRDGRTVSARPDCSGMLGAAMTAFGYKLDYPPSSTHYNIAGVNKTLDFIKNPDGSVSRDWVLLNAKTTQLQPGDITGRSGAHAHTHASFPIDVSNNANPKGLDSGGTTNIKESAAAATAFLNGSTNPPWRWAMGTADYAENIVRYVGGGDDFMFDDVSNISDLVPSVVEIPPLPMDNSEVSDTTGPIIINQYQTDWNLPEYIDQVLTNEYDIEATRIKDLANQIFDELPEYLEDDDDDEYDYDDDAEYIRQLAANFL